MYHTNISGVVSGKAVSGEFFTKNKTDMDKVIDFLDVSLDNYFSSQDQVPEESKNILRIITKTKDTNLINIFSNLYNSIDDKKKFLSREAPYTQEEEKCDWNVFDTGLHPISHDNVRVNYDKSDVNEFIQVAKDNFYPLFRYSESEDEGNKEPEGENYRSYLNILSLSDSPNFDEKTLSNYIKDLTKLMDLYRSGRDRINKTKRKQIMSGVGVKDITTAHINIPESQYEIILADLQYRLDNKIFSEVQAPIQAPIQQTPIRVEVQVENPRLANPNDTSEKSQLSKQTVINFDHLLPCEVRDISLRRDKKAPGGGAGACVFKSKSRKSKLESQEKNVKGPGFFGFF
jgi:hypothetical protein